MKRLQLCTAVLYGLCKQSCSIYSMVPKDLWMEFLFSEYFQTTKYNWIHRKDAPLVSNTDIVYRVSFFYVLTHPIKWWCNLPSSVFEWRYYVGFKTDAYVNNVFCMFHPGTTLSLRQQIAYGIHYLSSPGRTQGPPEEGQLCDPRHSASPVILLICCLVRSPAMPATWAPRL